MLHINGTVDLGVSNYVCLNLD